jgi:hypothetical protein
LRASGALSPLSAIKLNSPVVVHGIRHNIEALEQIVDPLLQDGANANRANVTRNRNLRIDVKTKIRTGVFQFRDTADSERSSNAAAPSTLTAAHRPAFESFDKALLALMKRVRSQ